MKRKALSLLLALSIILTWLPAQVSAANDSGQKAMAIVSKSASNLKGIIPATDASLFEEIFGSVSTVGKVISSFIGPINTTITFLKLIGVIEDSSVNIQKQLKSINEKISEMDGKLDDMTEKLDTLLAATEFNARSEKALSLRDNWRSFKTGHMENNMDRLMTEYKAMLLNGLQNWCKDPDSRAGGDIDLSELILFYLPDNGTYEFNCTAENGIPRSFPNDGRYIKLSGALLPGRLSWNVNTYREDIASYIAEAIKNAADEGNYDLFEAYNYPEFTAEGAEYLNDALIKKTAEDAVDLLSFRVAAQEVNAGASFSLEVKRLFENYCAHLLEGEEGLDAMYKSMYLTHAFEYQITDDFNNFSNGMILTTGTYGSFALNITGMSGFITDSEKKEVEDLYYDTIIKIEDRMDKGLTGDTHYCYATNTDVYLTQLGFYSEGMIEVKKDAAYDIYVGYTAKPTEVFHSDIGSGRKADPSELIGDTNALLLSYLLQSSGEDASIANLANKIGKGALYYLDYPVVTSYGPEQNLSISGHYPLMSFNVIGGYFPFEKTVYLDSLPGKAEAEYFQYARMHKGSVVDLSSGKLKVNKVLSAFALYGENHLMWVHDEAAILGGPTDECLFEYFKMPVSSKTVTTPDGQVTYYYHSYDQQTRYNALLSVPTGKKISGDLNDPLDSFTELCREIASGTDDFDYGEFEAPDNGYEGSRIDEPEEAGDPGALYGSTDASDTRKPQAAPLEIPDRYCSRAFMIKALWRSAGSPEAGEGALKFTDVPENADYLEALLWAQNSGIVKGTSETVFSPDSVLTRAQAITMLFRYMGAEASGTMPFTDVPVGSYYYDSVLWAYQNGIVVGTSESTFSPDDKCLDSQIGSLFSRLFED